MWCRDCRSPERRLEKTKTITHESFEYNTSPLVETRVCLWNVNYGWVGKRKLRLSDNRISTIGRLGDLTVLNAHAANSFADVVTGRIRVAIGEYWSFESLSQWY